MLGLLHGLPAHERGYSDCLDDVGRQHLARVRLASRTMGSLLDGLSELSLVGARRIDAVEVDLGRIAEQAVLKVRERDPERQVGIEIARGLRIVADTVLIRILIVKLLDNAWQFTAGTERAAIEIGTDDGGTSFRVTNNGTGFDMAHVGKLFKPFQTLHGSDQGGGNGFGLAIVKRIAERHGATVRIS